MKCQICGKDIDGSAGSLCLRCEKIHGETTAELISEM
jgi:hypothetical protein